MIPMMIPFRWSIYRRSSLPILELRGETPVSEIEPILISQAVGIIEEAKRFKGVLFQDEGENYQQTGTVTGVTVAFKLIFPNETSISKFKNYMNPA